MTNDIEFIERYFENKLTKEELELFNKRVQSEPRFAKEVESHKILLDSFELFAKKNKLKNLLDDFHEDIRTNDLQIAAQNPKKVRKIWKRYAVPMGIAAGLALIMLFNSLWTWNNVISLEQEQNTQYRQLVKEVDKVKLKQRRSEKTINKEIRKIKESLDESGQYGGATAFAISSNGFLITNSHVVHHAKRIYLEQKNGDTLVRLKAEIYHEDKKLDLAILKVTDHKFIGFGNIPYKFRTDEAELGETVYTLAYPRKEIVFGEGAVSAKNGYQSGIDTTAYQVSIPVNPGNSGGPVLDNQGNLIGIVKAKDTMLDGATYAIKAKYLQNIINSLSNNLVSEPIITSQQNTIQWLNRPQQIRTLQNFIYLVKAYRR